jgi:hypothetical protein
MTLVLNMMSNISLYQLSIKKLFDIVEPHWFRTYGTYSKGVNVFYRYYVPIGTSAKDFQHINLN